jgi:hypothetical protein
MSYKGLSASRLETPRTFTDRIYLTDIVENLWEEAFKINGGASIRLVWRKRYFPWRISIELLGGKILLSSKLLGDSSWTSVIEMQFTDFEGGGAEKIGSLMENFVAVLGRPPYESQYWDDGIWHKFTETSGITRQQVEGDWAKYISILEAES